MRAGRLRHQITIQGTTETQNSYGEPVTAWTDFASVRAEITPISGREYFAAQEVRSDVTHRVRLRYLSGVTSQMRIMFGSRIMDIESVINVNERNHELQLMCVERT